MGEFPGKVRIIFRHFPLAGHPWSPLAHRAAECANKAGHFWDYYDRLYNEQQNWSGMANPTQTFFEYAKDYGMNLDQFAQCIVNPETTQIILKERQEGERLKITSTPTFFINGDNRFAGAVELQNKGIEFIRQVLNSSQEKKTAA